MTRGMRRTYRWVVCGGATLLFVALLGGCIQWSTAPAVDRSAQPTPTAAAGSSRPVLVARLPAHAIGTAAIQAWHKAWHAVAAEDTGWNVRVESANAPGALPDLAVILEFTVHGLRKAPLTELSIQLSAWTATLIPGYGRVAEPVEAFVELRRGGVPLKQAVLASEATGHVLLWLPFAVRGTEAMQNESRAAADAGRMAVVRDLLRQAWMVAN